MSQCESCNDWKSAYLSASYRAITAERKLSDLNIRLLHPYAPDIESIRNALSKLESQWLRNKESLPPVYGVILAEAWNAISRIEGITPVKWCCGGDSQGHHDPACRYGDANYAPSSPPPDGQLPNSGKVSQ